MVPREGRLERYTSDKKALNGKVHIYSRTVEQ